MNKTTFEFIWIGIDISKKHLDASLFLNGKYYTKKVLNDSEGFEALEKWAKRLAPEGAELRFCLESTGDYGFNAVFFFSGRGYHTSVENPAKVRYFGLYKGRLNKTDKADARLICDYARESNPAASPFMDETKREIFRLYRRKKQLQKQLTGERNRMECPEAIGETALQSILSHIKDLKKYLRQIQARLRRLVMGHQEMKAVVDLVKSTKVLGIDSAIAILAEMPSVESCTCKSWAAATGVNPVTRQSGNSSSPGKMSRGGRKNVRAQVWMPVLKSKDKVPELHDLYERLKAKGRTHKQAMVACVRKLLMILYAILKSNKPYDPKLREAAQKPILMPKRRGEFMLKA